MKKATKLVSLLLALVLLVGVTACGGKTTPAASSGTPAASTPAASAPAASASQSKPDPHATRRHLTVGISAKANVIDYENNAYTKYVEEQLNADIDFFFFSDNITEKRQQLFTMVAAKEKLPDVLYNISLDAEIQRTLGEDGVLLDLAPYFDHPEKYDWVQEWYDVVKEYEVPESVYTAALVGSRTPDGNQYGFPALGSSRYDNTNSIMSINKAWLDKLGLDMPKTWDELVTVLKAFRDNDCNGNGVRDEIPMAGSVNHVYTNAAQWVVNTMGTIYEDDGYFFSVDDDGTVYVPYYTQEWRDGLRRLRYLMDEKLLSELTFTMPSNATEFKKLWTPANGVAMVGVVGGHVSVHSDRQSSEVLREYVPLPPLEGSFAVVKGGSGSNFNFITTDCEDVDLAIEFFMLCCHGDPVPYYHAMYGEEGVDWVMAKDYKTGLMLPYRINAQAYTGQTTTTWSVAMPRITDSMKSGDKLWTTGDPYPDDGVMDIEEYKTWMSETYAEAVWSYAAEHNPKNVGFNTPIYTNQENDENGNIKTDVETYAKQMRAQFASGQVDIESDAEWNNYMKTLEDMGIKTLLKNTQAAYDRMYKK